MAKKIEKRSFKQIWEDLTTNQKKDLYVQFTRISFISYQTMRNWGEGTSTPNHANVKFAKEALEKFLNAKVDLYSLFPVR